MTFINHNGKLAFTSGWFTSQDRPVQYRHISVSKARATDWPHLFDPPVLDRQIDWSGNQGVVRFSDHRRSVLFDTTDWERVTEEQPVKKPRRGKRQGQQYDWEWSSGEWRRVWL